MLRSSKDAAARAALLLGAAALLLVLLVSGSRGHAGPREREEKAQEQKRQEEGRPLHRAAVPPIARTICFWNTMYTMKIGMDANTACAIRYPSPLVCA